MCHVIKLVIVDKQMMNMVTFHDLSQTYLLTTFKDILYVDPEYLLELMLSTIFYNKILNKRLFHNFHG